MIHLVSEPSPAKANGHKINIYFNVNQGIISCSALCIMCLSRGADNVQQRKDLFCEAMMFKNALG